jgi:hypothetical protein
LSPLLNELFTSEWRFFHNFFCPSVKLLEKQRVASKPIKRYDTPKQRVMGSPDIQAAVKRALTQLFETLNPFHLRRAMEGKLKKIFQMCHRNSY